MRTAPSCVLAALFLLCSAPGVVRAAQTSTGYIWGATSALGGVLEGPDADNPPALCLTIGVKQPAYLLPVPKNPDGTNADCTKPGSLLTNRFPIAVSGGGPPEVTGYGDVEGADTLPSVLDLRNGAFLMKTGALKAEASIGFIQSQDFGQVGTSVNLFLPRVSCGKCAGGSVSLTLGASEYDSGGTAAATLGVITANAVNRTSDSFAVKGSETGPGHFLTTTPLVMPKGEPFFSVLITLEVSQLAVGTTTLLIDSITAPFSLGHFRTLDPRGSSGTTPASPAPGSGTVGWIAPVFGLLTAAGRYTTASGHTEGFGVLSNGAIAAPIIEPHDTLHYTAPAGINDFGTIVGTYENTTPFGGNGPVDTFHGFVRSRAGKFTTFDFGKGLSTGLQGINDSGDIAGDFGSSAVVTRGFLLPKGGTATTFGVSGLATFPLALNAADDAVGHYVDASGIDHGFEWTPTGGLVPFDYPEAVATFAAGINDGGTISGYFTDAAGKHHGFYGGLGRFAQYDLAGAAGTLPRGITNFGGVIGSYEDGSGRLHGFAAQLCAADQSGNVEAKRGAIVFDKKTGEYTQTVTLKNTAGVTIAGPLHLLFEDLPAGVFPANGSGFSNCVAAGAPYITAVPAGATLDAGRSLSVPVDFVNTSKTTISYTPAIVAGPRV